MLAKATGIEVEGRAHTRDKGRIDVVLKHKDFVVAQDKSTADIIS